MKYPMCICTDLNSHYEAFLPDFIQYDISCNNINTLREVRECIQERFRKVFSNKYKNTFPIPSPIEEIKNKYIFFKVMFIDIDLSCFD